MTGAQLLADLAARDFVGWVGAPIFIEEKPDGTKLYHVPVRQEWGYAATYILQPCYVVDEGLPSEEAFYKDTIPNQKPRESALMQWIMQAIDAAPNNFQGVQILWISERWEMVIFCILEGTPLVQKVYYSCKKVNGGAPVEIQNFNPALLGSLQKV